MQKEIEREGKEEQRGRDSAWTLFVLASQVLTRAHLFWELCWDRGRAHTHSCLSVSYILVRKDGVSVQWTSRICSELDMPVWQRQTKLRKGLKKLQEWGIHGRSWAWMMTCGEQESRYRKEHKRGGRWTHIGRPVCGGDMKCWGHCFCGPNLFKRSVAGGVADRACGHHRVLIWILRAVGDF